jgi:DNA-binding transcriptional MerR regulator
MSEKKEYTIKDVAELSGVSTRTLRFYDEIGLLKPAFCGENGYRYYRKEQLLLLQQILFYRELKFELATIQKILSDPTFNKVEALKAHKEFLLKETHRTEDMIRTIDKTLDHLEKETPMSDNEIYKGFDPKKQAEYEQYLVDTYGESAKKKIEISKQRTQGWTKQDYEGVKEDYDRLHRALTDALTRGLKPDDKGVQELVKQHYNVICRFWTPNKEAYIGLGKMYCEHPDFRKLYDSHHPKLAEFLANAISVFAQNELA